MSVVVVFYSLLLALTFAIDPPPRIARVNRRRKNSVEIASSSISATPNIDPRAEFYRHSRTDLRNGGFISFLAPLRSE